MRRPTLLLVLVLASGCASPAGLPSGYRDRAFESPSADAPWPSAESTANAARDDRPLDQLDLATARALALTRNHTTAAAAAAVERAIAQIAQARAALLPTLSATLTETYSNRRRVVDIGGGNSFTIQPSQVANGSMQLAWTLFSFGRHELAVEASRMEVSTAALAERRARQNLLTEVSTAWYRIHEALDLEKVAQDALATSTRQLQDATNVFEAGRVTKDQVLTARVNALRNGQELLVASNAVVHARRVLNGLLDRVLDAPLTLAAPEAFSAVRLDGARLKTIARRANPDLLAFRTRRATLELTRDSVGRSFAPEVVGTLNGTVTDFTGATGFSNEYFATLGIQWRPVDGGRRIGQLDEIRAALVQLRHEEIDALRVVELEIDRSLLELAELESLVNVAQESIGAADEAYRIVASQFQNGRSTSREVLEQQLTASQSRADLSRARYRYRVVLARLESTVGVARSDFDDESSAASESDVGDPRLP